jgi:hypothetical protein
MEGMGPDKSRFFWALKWQRASVPHLGPGGGGGEPHSLAGEGGEPNSDTLVLYEYYIPSMSLPLAESEGHKCFLSSELSHLTYRQFIHHTWCVL